MDVVAYAGSVRGRIISAKNRELREFADCHLANVWEQVIGETIRILTHQPAWVCSNRIEIAQ
ncbi:hypothetical protein D3C84_981000 [compost metagenome]